MTDSGRRRFLRQTAFGAAALVAARALPSGRATAQESAATPDALKFFSKDEYRVFSAAAGRLTGHPADAGGARIDTALRADAFLITEDPEIQEQIHLLLTIFNSVFAAILLSFTFSRFTDMDSAAQDRYIEGWMTSTFAFRRTAFQALKRLSMSMYYTDDRAWDEIGYHGIAAPGETQ
ncbi:MAG TPA: hypothetical protein VMM80_08190 [Bacteroidota bacterium]|nr:hypothetical protein [Bacteroidota bacterium]